MKKQTIVWGVEYRFRKKWWEKYCGTKWCSIWTGPIGVYERVPSTTNEYWYNEIAGRPYFFRTRKLARNWVKKRYPKGSSCQGRVKKYVLTWESVEETKK
jgi:hypothetical protein